MQETGAPTETTAASSSRGRSWRTAAALVIGALFVGLFSFGLVNISQDGHPLSVIDEHIHFDTSVRAMHGEIPWRGALLGDELIEEWSCGVGHQGGGLPYPCGDPRLDAHSIPSGAYTTGYGHYPTYFFAAAGFTAVLDAITGSTDLLDGFRAFSATTMIIGVLLCGVFAWALGLRGAAFLAALSVPVAASMVVFTGTIVNPSSTSVLSGALIGGTCLLWMKRGKGFTWVAIAIGFCSAIAVTSSLPAGGVLIAMLIVLVGRRWGLVTTPAWNPRWWQFAVLWALVLAPIVLWGRVISARATVPDSLLYGFIPPSGRTDILLNAIRELFLLHTPWRATGGIYRSPEGTVPLAIFNVSESMPVWITVLVFGTVVVAAYIHIARAFAARRTAFSTVEQRPVPLTVSAAALLAVSMVATIVLYPPALRISNWLTMGFDFPIVERYSNAFTAALVLAVLVWLPRKPAALVAAAAIGIVTAVGTVAAGF